MSEATCATRSSRNNNGPVNSKPAQEPPPGHLSLRRMAGHSCIFMSYNGELFKRERPNGMRHNKKEKGRFWLSRLTKIVILQ